MTEGEWLSCTKPWPLMDFLGGTPTLREWQLFGIGCCRQIYKLLPDERSRRAIDVAERFADGHASDEERRLARTSALAAAELKLKSKIFWPKGQGEWAAYFVAAKDTYKFLNSTLQRAFRALADDVFERLPKEGKAPVEVWKSADDLAGRCFAIVLRDIFRNPFRPVTLDPAWLTPKVKTLAQAIYDDRAFERMPELADALAEAGSSNPDILSHCRGPGPHVRGCWVVDLVLGKE